MPRVALLDEETAAQMSGVAGPQARRAFMHRPRMADAIGNFNSAVAASELPIRLQELVRYRIAEINGCVRCQSYRMPGAAEAGATEEVLAMVGQWRDHDEFSQVESLALDFAERFSLRPHQVDDELVQSLVAQLGDAGMTDLAISVSKYVAIGRLIATLDLDQTCPVGEAPQVVGQLAQVGGR